MSKSFQKEYALKYLERNCEPYEVKNARAAFDGDEKAALSFCISLNNDKRGIVAVAMWRNKVPVTAFRAFLSSAWDHDHRYVIEAAENRRTLGHMFRYAAFPIPSEFPDVVTLWRGTSKLTLDEAREGYSWTNDRDVACWFAMRFAETNGFPLVLAAEVSKSDIALFHTERSEAEAVLIRKPIDVEIDGTPEDWVHRYERFQAVKNARKSSGAL